MGWERAAQPKRGFCTVSQNSRFWKLDWSLQLRARQKWKVTSLVGDQTKPLFSGDCNRETWQPQMVPTANAPWTEKMKYEAWFNTAPGKFHKRLRKSFQTGQLTRGIHRVKTSSPRITHLPRVGISAKKKKKKVQVSKMSTLRIHFSNKSYKTDLNSWQDTKTINHHGLNKASAFRISSRIPLKEALNTLSQKANANFSGTSKSLKKVPTCSL